MHCPQKIFALTMGDPAGVGPEIIAASWLSSEIPAHIRRWVFGDVRVMQAAINLVGLDIKAAPVYSILDLPGDNEIMPVMPLDLNAFEAPRNQISALGGAAAYESLERAIDLALARQVDAIVTAPLNKASLAEAGIQFPGHTEILAHRCSVANSAMMLHLPTGPNVSAQAGISVVHVTLHTAIKNVPSLLTTAAIIEKCHLANKFTESLLAGKAIDRRPRIGVAALNPHGGEMGLFGDEEQSVIIPAVKQAAAAGLPVFGPFPCDTLMLRAAHGDFDVVVAMYHDQGHIALKLLGMSRAVNITLGLPIIRTSVAHGTAYDIAWRGEADSQGLVEAVKIADQLVSQRSSMTNWSFSSSTGQL